MRNSTGDLVAIANYQHAFQAHSARSTLDAAGLQSFIEGENAQTALSYVGSAVGGIRILVAASDAEAARELLEESASRSPSEGTEWLCAGCGETVDAGFDICWKCGGDERAMPVERPLIAPQPEEPVEHDYRSELPVPRRVHSAESNPYSPPQTETKPSDIAAMRSQVTHTEAAATETRSELLERAWRQAIISAFFPPIALLSLWTLVDVLGTSDRWTAAERRSALASFGIALFVCMVGSLGLGAWLVAF